MQTIDRLFEEMRVDIVSSNGRKRQDLERGGGLVAGIFVETNQQIISMTIIATLLISEKSLTDYIRTLAGEM